MRGTRSEDNLKKYKLYQKVLVCILPFATVVFLYLGAKFALEYSLLPPCMLYQVTGINCAGCGATRSVEALVNGDILLSLRQNILVIFAIICAVIFYFELFCNVVLEKKLRTPLHSLKFLWTIMIFALAYTVLRNIFPIIAPI